MTMPKNWYTPLRNQGQMVKVSYSYHEGRAYKRVFDASDRTTNYYVGEIDWDRELADVDTEAPPCVLSWVEVSA